MEYIIKKVEHLSELEDVFKNGFIELFDECFNIAPYYLKYPDEELFKIYSDHFRTGFVLFAYLDGEMAGFAGSRPLLADEYVSDDVKTFLDDPENYFYHSDLGVIGSQRGRGLAQTLLRETIARTPVNKIIMRTKEDNIPSLALHVKMGFRQIKVTQTIKRKNSLGEEIDDNRVYLVYNKEAELNV